MINAKHAAVLVLTVVAAAQPAFADLKKDSTVLITGAAAAPKSTSVLVSEPVRSDSFAFDKSAVQFPEKTLRCWQDGVMIVAEHDWNLAVAQAPILSKNTSQKAYAFNYSDTFCLYIGG